MSLLKLSKLHLTRDGNSIGEAFTYSQTNQPQVTYFVPGDNELIIRGPSEFYHKCEQLGQDNKYCYIKINDKEFKVLKEIVYED
jgi:hypothetical protein